MTNSAKNSDSTSGKAALDRRAGGGNINLKQIQRPTAFSFLAVSGISSVMWAVCRYLASLSPHVAPGSSLQSAMNQLDAQVAAQNFDLSVASAALRVGVLCGVLTVLIFPVKGSSIWLQTTHWLGISTRTMIGAGATVFFVTSSLAWSVVVGEVRAYSNQGIWWVNMLTGLSQSGMDETHQDAYFLMLFGLTLACIYIGTLSIRRTLQIGSAALAALPVGIFLFDRNEFTFHFTNLLVAKYLPWFTNETLLYACLLVVGITALWPKLATLKSLMWRLRS